MDFLFLYIAYYFIIKGIVLAEAIKSVDYLYRVIAAFGKIILSV